jgi:hypothetical protein
MIRAHPHPLAKSTMRWEMWLLIAVVSLYPVTASANAGTPLMWAGFLHLFVGNLFIGLFEGALLVWIFGTPRGTSMGLMILANYISAWLGFGILENFHPSTAPSLSEAWQWLWLTVVGTYVITLLLEWPFVALIFKGTPHPVRRSIWASFLVQTFSYALLFGWYGLAGHASLFMKTKPVELAAFSLPNQVQVYYLSTDDGDVYRMPLSGGEAVKVMDLDAGTGGGRLFVRRNEERPAELDLVARLEPAQGYEPRFVTVMTHVKYEFTPGTSGRRGTDVSLDGSIWDDVGEIHQLGAKAQSRWKITTGYWSNHGLIGVNKETEERFKLAFETPFLGLPVRSAILLPGDKVLFQLGRGHIYILDANTRELALLCKGKGPVAMMGDGEGKVEAADKPVSAE